MKAVHDLEHSQVIGDERLENDPNRWELERWGSDQGPSLTNHDETAKSVAIQQGDWRECQRSASGSRYFEGRVAYVSVQVRLQHGKGTRIYAEGGKVSARIGREVGALDASNMLRKAAMASDEPLMPAGAMKRTDQTRCKEGDLRD